MPEPGSRLGGWLRRLGRAVSAVPEASAEPLSRRDFLTGRVFRPLVGHLAAPVERAQAAAAAVLPPTPNPAAQAIARTFPVLRPPGAVAEADFMAGCTRCGDCITACPHGAVVVAPERLRAVAGTPIIEPLAQPCLMCPDTPCITACAPRVLRRAEGAPVPRLGVARILAADCLAHQGVACRSCLDACPVDGAIRLADGRPEVVDDRCTGCGGCQPVCPAAPRKAVILIPGHPVLAQ